MFNDEAWEQIEDATNLLYLYATGDEESYSDRLAMKAKLEPILERLNQKTALRRSMGCKPESNFAEDPNWLVAKKAGF